MGGDGIRLHQSEAISDHRGIGEMKRLFYVFAAVACFCHTALAMTDNGDGTRTFTVGSGGDYSTLAELVWVHPVGVTAGDTLRSTSLSAILPEDLVAQASGTSLLPITISVGARSFSDGGHSYLRFVRCIASGATGDAFLIAGNNNKIINCTIYNSAGDGVELTSNAEIKNTIFEAIGGSDINENGGVATVAGNYADSDGDPLLTSDYRLSPGSPAINAGTPITGIHDQATPATDFVGTPILRCLLYTSPSPRDS